MVEDLKLNEESSDMTSFAQTPPKKEGKYARPLSMSIFQRTHRKLSYIQDNWKEIQNVPPSLSDSYATFMTTAKL
jgi:hypothetical protein